MYIQKIWHNTTSYSAAISACAQGKCWQQALELLEDCGCGCGRGGGCRMARREVARREVGAAVQLAQRSLTVRETAPSRARTRRLAVQRVQRGAALAAAQAGVAIGRALATEQ